MRKRYLKTKKHYHYIKKTKALSLHNNKRIILLGIYILNLCTNKIA